MLCCRLSAPPPLRKRDKSFTEIMFWWTWTCSSSSSSSGEQQANKLTLKGAPVSSLQAVAVRFAPSRCRWCQLSIRRNDARARPFFLVFFAREALLFVVVRCCCPCGGPAKGREGGGAGGGGGACEICYHVCRCRRRWWCVG